jgi:hypothetical protein
MILQTKITVEELSKNGKNHNWERHLCNKCNRFMWGHGFVARYFASAVAVVFLKRYRCPDCSVVVTTRPEGHWPSIRSSTGTIYQVLFSRIKEGHWPLSFPRQRGGHWLKRFSLNARMSCETELLKFLEFCFLKQLHFFA